MDIGLVSTLKTEKNVNRKVCKFGCFVPMPHRTSGDVMYHGHGRILNGYSSENCWDTFGAHPARRLAAEKYVPRERRIVSLIFEGTQKKQLEVLKNKLEVLKKNLRYSKRT